MIGHRKWCVDVNNIHYSKNINGTFPLEIIEGHTQDISKFIFHLLETIWYFNNFKAPQILRKQKYIWSFHTTLDMKRYNTLIKRRKIQITSSDQSYILYAGTLVHTRSIPTKNQSKCQSSLIWR